MASRSHADRLRKYTLIFIIFSTANAINDDSTRRTMEEFAGYPDHRDLIDSVFSLSPVNEVELQRQIDELAAFSDTPAPSVTRVLYSENDVLARRYIKQLMSTTGLSIYEDVVGNIFGRWDGYDKELSVVATGSHIDAIPYSGKYDGVVGVLGAIEAINVLKRSGFQPKRTLEVIMFTSEEPTRFGISCLGSRLLAGSETLANMIKYTVDSQNITFFDAASSAGYAVHTYNLSDVFVKKGRYFAFLELHIEQGPILEEEGVPIGVVTAIAAPASIKVEYQGAGGHAGAVLMPARNDAGLAAAELALAVERHVLESGSVDTVGTVGILQLHPGAINSIASKSHIEIDTRDINETRRDLVIKNIRQSAMEIARKRAVQLSDFTIINQDPPAVCGDSIVDAVRFSAEQLNLNHKPMISRAYHDSLFMARISPTGMIFIPCYKGFSHRPDEYASIDAISNGIRVLALSLAKLSFA